MRASHAVLAAALAAIVHCLAPAPRLHAADTAPAWLLAVRNQPVTLNTGDSTSLILLDENIVSIGTNGRRVTRQRQVIRILKREGRERAVAQMRYATKIDKVSDFQAWLIPASGPTRNFGRKDIVDIATSPEALYADTRAAIINVAAEADAGGTFGWEGTLDELCMIGQGYQWMQGSAPVATARLIVRVPKEWKLEWLVRAHAPIAPQVSESSYSWELRDLPAFAEEPFGPGMLSAAVNVVYDIRPPRAQSSLRTFDTWADTVAYALELHGRPAQPDTSVRAKAQELCATATSPWEKIRALATYAQKLRYIAIAMNLGSGGGYTPHPAAEVLRCGYGDCKDKTTLLRALLAAEGMRGWPVLCFSGDPTSVREEWPSPIQFNHVFVAIELGDAEVPDTTFVVDHPGLGRVLLFDPTDTYSPVGEFPDYNQGAQVLICAPGTTGLTPVPIAPPERNHIRRRAKAAIAPGGGAIVGVIETSSGAPAADTRRSFENEAKLRDDFEKRLLTVHPGANLTRVELVPTKRPGEISMRTSFGAPRFCRVIRDQLLAFSPVVRVEEMSAPLPAGPRTQPIFLPSYSVDDSTEFLLPEGYRVSELGKPVLLERDFGRYELTLSAGEKNIIVRRQRTLRGGVHPASDYEEIRAFVEAARKAESTPIVLERVATP